MRGEDSIFPEKKNGKPTGRFIAKLYYRDGRKRKAKQLLAKSAAEARKLLEQMRERRLQDLRKERDADALSKAERSTLAGFFETWLKMPSAKGKLRAESTVYGYKCLFKTHVELVLGNKPLEQITQADIMDLDLSLAERSAVRQAVFRLLRALFRSAVHLDLLVKSPLDKLRQPKHTAERWTPLTDAQQVTFVTAVAGDWYEALFLTALDGGFREGELFALKPDDYDLENMTVTIRRQITEVGRSIRCVELLKSQHAYRTVELSAITIGAVTRHKARLLASGLGKSGLMYPSTPRTQYDESKTCKLTWEIVCSARARTTGTRGYRKLAEEYGVSAGAMFYALQGKTWNRTRARNKRFGEAMRKGTFLDRFKRLCAAAGLPNIPFHYLRHTAATRWIQQGVPLEEVRRRLGHKDVATTLRFYAHVMPGYGREAADGFDRLLSGPKHRTGTDAA
jgi:integrase